MEFDRHRLNRAIQKFPLEDWLVQRGAEAVQQYEWQLTCPTCGKENLIVNVRKRAWHCWSCEGAHTQGVIGRGGLLSLLRLIDRVDKQRAVNAILQSFRDVFPIDQLHGELALTYQEVGEVRHSAIGVPAECRPAWVDYGGRLPYCRRRGLTAQDCYDFSLYWCPTGRYANRLVFPVLEGGVPVYWQARAMWEEHEHRADPLHPRRDRYVKSLNPPKPSCTAHDKHDAGCGECRRLAAGVATSAEVLMNLQRACAYERVVITEGPIDCIHVGADAVCTFGKQLSPVQVGKLLGAGVKAIDLMWDGPSPTEPLGAWPDMWGVAKRLAGLFDTRLIFLPQGDPGDYSRDQLAWLREHNSRRPDAAPHRLLEV